MTSGPIILRLGKEMPLQGYEISQSALGYFYLCPQIPPEVYFVVRAMYTANNTDKF
jgi:hypothetical protein